MDRKRQAPLLPTRVLVIALCLVTFAIGLLIISTTALAQDNSTGDQSEITVVDRTIVPANSTTAKANVTHTRQQHHHKIANTLSFRHININIYTAEIFLQYPFHFSIYALSSQYNMVHIKSIYNYFSAEIIS
jgi:hypothetical protein